MTRLLQCAYNSSSTGRKGLVYLVGYPIPYRTIPYHGTVSWGGHTRPLRKIWSGKLLVSWNGLGNFWYMQGYPMLYAGVWEIYYI